MIKNILMSLYPLLEVLFVLLPVVLSVAYITVIERKVLASIQRRVGPNQVGYYGLLQPFADALKLILKEAVVPQHATKSFFYLAPIISLVASLLGWAVIPFGSGLAISDFSLGILFSIAVSGLGIYGIFLSGWSSNNKFALLGSLRSTAQIISYELILSSCILIVIFVSGSFHYATVIETQQSIWYFVPLFPAFVMFFISALAETGRTPFDLPEAESELVAGYMTEYSAAPFVFFFLAEYASIILISCLTAIFFFGGYHMPLMFSNITYINIQSLILGLKTVFFCFIFVWIRATLPRMRYTDLMRFMWSDLLPFACALILLVPSLLIAFDIAPVISY